VVDNMIDWISKEDELPVSGVRVLVFSPEYPADDPMRFRVMDPQFVRISGEATHWAYLVGPV